MNKYHFAVIAVYRVTTARGERRVAKRVHTIAKDRISAFESFVRKLSTSERSDLHRAMREGRFSFASAHMGAPYVEFVG